MAIPEHAQPRPMPNLKDRIWGNAKRVAGELGGRPDLVMEGEAQGTGMPREDQPQPRG